MRTQSIQKLFAFIITVMMFSVVTEFAIGQACNKNKPCPPWLTCVNNHCVRLRSPMPFLIGTDDTGKRVFLVTVSSNPGSRSATISFSLHQKENIGVKIFDATGRLVQTFVGQFFKEGEHSIEWNTTGINEGVYTLQLQSAPFSHTEKLIVAN